VVPERVGIVEVRHDAGRVWIFTYWTFRILIPAYTALLNLALTNLYEQFVVTIHIYIESNAIEEPTTYSMRRVSVGVDAQSKTRWR
jgi:hypothetical protein